MEPFPEEIVRFLDGNIESIDQLEILRLLGEDPTSYKSVTTLAEEVQADAQIVVAHAIAMRDRGLIHIETRDHETVCRYGPATPELASVAGRLLQLYKERPVSMIKLVYARSHDPLRTFAEAFRIRKGGKEG